MSENKNIVILTGSDPRHQFFIHQLNTHFSISQVFMEKCDYPSPIPKSEEESIAWNWFFKRRDQSENEMIFKSSQLPRKNNPGTTYLENGELNSLDTIAKGHTDIIRWRKGRVSGQLLNVFGGTRALDDYLKAWDLLYRLEEKYKDDLAVVGSSSEMKRVMNEGKIAILPSLEGAIRLGDNMFLVRSFYKLGLRSVTFAYYTNQFADGSNDTVKHNGISKLGEEMVKK